MKSNWQTKKLGDLSEIKTGKKDVNEGNPSGKYPFFTCAREHTYSDVFSFDTEALLVAGNGDVGHVSYYKGKFEAYQRTYVLSGFKDVLPQYLFLFLDGFLKDTVSKQKLGNTMPYIKMGMLTDFMVPVPPLPEQKRIVKTLDDVFEKLAKAKENAEKNLQNSKELFESYLQSVFANPGKDWEEKTLGDVCEMINRGISPKYSEVKGLAILNQKCVREHKVNFELARLHDLKSKKISLDKYIQEGDVLVNSTGVGTLGRVAQVRELKVQATVDSHVTIVRPKKGLFFDEFFGFAMIFIEEEIARSGAGASGQTELARSVLKDNFSVTFPKSITEQKSIVKKLDALSTETKKLEKIYEQKLADLEELKKAVLSKAFQGKL